VSTSLHGVYGASGFGREVMPIVRARLVDQGIPVHRIVFVDDQITLPEVNGHRVMSFERFLDEPALGRDVVVAIANATLRKSVADRCAKRGIRIAHARSASAVQLDNVSIGEGSVLCGFVTLTSNIQIGKHFHANLYSYVGHDCVIGDFVTFGPCVQCNGNVQIDDFAYIGSGAMIRQGRPSAPLRIGKGAVIGMGAVVTADVPAGATVVGNPARPLVKG
jgi:sugar O-acyltransferase (sialic acid O-acetyltransferase NeuD family)